MIEITVTGDSGPARTYAFDGSATIRVGREDDNEIVIPSPGCSRHHAEIVRRDGRWLLLDRGSTNGVVHRGRRVARCDLVEGTVVTIADHELMFGFGGAAGQERSGRADGPLYLVFRERGRSRSLRLRAGEEYLIGRSPAADLVLDDTETSKRHTLVLWRPDGFAVRDLGSSNGTLLNGRPVDEAAIGPGDEIVVGRTTLAVRDEITDLIDQEEILGSTRLGLPTRPDLLPRSPDAGAATVRLPPPPPPRRGLVVGLIVVATACFAVAGSLVWRRLQPPTRPGPSETVTSPEIVVQVEAARLEEVVFAIEGTGTVAARRAVTVSAQVPGQVVELPATEGAVVRRGDLLARQADGEIRHQIEVARASVSEEQLVLAREDYERKGRLFEQGAIMRSVFDQARATYLALEAAHESAAARIAQLEEQAAKTRIRSPLDGVVVHRAVEAGEFLGPGLPVAIVADLDEVVVTVDLVDRDLVRVAPGQEVEATVDAFPGRTFRGTVATLGSAANPVTRSFEVSARFENPGHELRPGMIASLSIIESRERGLVVPATALVEETEGDAAVFVVSAGQAHHRSIEVVGRQGRLVQVRAGLEAGEEVVVNGQERLTHGLAVRTYRSE